MRKNHYHHQLSRFLFSISLILTVSCAHAVAESHSENEYQRFSLSTEVEKWKKLIPLKDVYTKQVDNYGNGDESLYGLRNLRLVLHGVYYRGGANNYYHKEDPRENMNPLPDDGLQNLCEKGFAMATYFYSKNFQTAPPKFTCNSPNASSKHEFTYQQKTAENKKLHESILKDIYNRIKGKVAGPIYGHCWNGWHASGMIAAISLQQFCGWSQTEAYNYWVKNTDGNSNGYQDVKNMVKNFKKFPELEISPAESQLICPPK